MTIRLTSLSVAPVDLQTLGSTVCCVYEVMLEHWPSVIPPANIALYGCREGQCSSKGDRTGDTHLAYLILWIQNTYYAFHDNQPCYVSIGCRHSTEHMPGLDVKFGHIGCCTTCTVQHHLFLMAARLYPYLTAATSHRVKRPQ